MKKKLAFITLLSLLFSVSSAKAGQTSAIYIVEEQDTLFGTAFTYNLPLQTLMKRNSLTNEMLYLGQSLSITKVQSLKGKTIVIDPGHGGFESGVVRNGIIEKEETLALGLSVKKHLEAAGAKVILTVDEGFQLFRVLPLSERASVAKRVNADLFISLHFNSNSVQSVSGTETYYNEKPYKNTHNPYPDKSRKLAESIQSHVIEKAKTNDLGVKENVFHVLRNNTVPSVLLEAAFVTNKEEAERIKTDDFKEKVALGISTGVMDYFRE